MKKIKTLFCLMAIACTSLFAAFLTGCNSLDQLKCKHEWSAVNVLEPSTCTEKGKGEKTCKLCEKVETVKLDFEHEPIVIEAVKPTCTEKGRTDYVVCYACEKVLVPYAELSPTGHKVVKDEAVAVTCLKDGLTEGEHCEVCKVVLLEQKKIVATGHNIVYYPEQAPTCTEAGYTAGEVCKICGAYDTREELPALGHTEVVVEGRAATCTTNGMTDSSYCSLCEEILKHKHIIRARGHKFEDGNICSICGEGQTISLLDLKVGDNLYGYKLVLAVSEDELFNTLAEVSIFEGCKVWDDSVPVREMVYLMYDFEIMEISFFGKMVFRIDVEGKILEYNEIILNDELEINTSYNVGNIGYIMNEYTEEERDKVLSLFEFVYVGE